MAVWVSFGGTQFASYPGPGWPGHGIIATVTESSFRTQNHVFVRFWGLSGLFSEGSESLGVPSGAKALQEGLKTSTLEFPTGTVTIPPNRTRTGLASYPSTGAVVLGLAFLFSTCENGLPTPVYPVLSINCARQGADSSQGLQYNVPLFL